MTTSADMGRAVEELLDLDLGFSPHEARTLVDRLGRQPTLSEATLFSIMWSEHCSYKSSRRALSTLPTAGEHVVLGPGEDAGIVRVGEWGGRQWCLVMAHESHNHPSQIVPLEGAATGIGGIVRDVYCMGADVVGVMDALRFGDPGGDRRMIVREIVSGVVDGIWQYGNALGVPNLGGDVAFDSSFDENCLVNVVAFGMVPEEDIVRSRVPAEAKSGDFDVILVGKPTDSSGFGGATLASKALEEGNEEEDRGAVQVPDPFLKRMLVLASSEVLARARQRRVPFGWKDLGAGGIACATSEMAAAAGFGLQIHLDEVPVAEEGLGPEVILCSETQERYCWVVPTWFSPEVLRIFNEDFEIPHGYHNAEARVIGRVTNTGRYEVEMKGARVCEVPVNLIIEPVMEQRVATRWPSAHRLLELPAMPDLSRMLVDVLRSFEHCSREAIYRHYDTEVKGAAVVRPGEADASMIAPLHGESLGLAFSIDGTPRYGRLDPYQAGASAVAEAMRNVVSVGATPWALTDCLNYGSPEEPQTYQAFLDGVRGVADAARQLWRKGSDREPVPIVSGNVSFYNHSTSGAAVAPSPVVCCAGLMRDYSKYVTPRLKRSGNLIYLLGTRYAELGGSEYLRILTGSGSGNPPEIRYDQERRRLHAVLDLIEMDLVRACHDISAGGLIVSAAEMALANGPDSALGLDLEAGVLDETPRADFWLFSESPGFLLEIAPDVAGEVENLLSECGVEEARVGSVVSCGRIAVRHGQDPVLSVTIRDLWSEWSNRITEAFGG